MVFTYFVVVLSGAAECDNCCHIKGIDEAVHQTKPFELGDHAIVWRARLSSRLLYLAHKADKEYRSISRTKPLWQVGKLKVRSRVAELPSKKKPSTWMLQRLGRMPDQ